MCTRERARCHETTHNAQQLISQKSRLRNSLFALMIEAVNADLLQMLTAEIGTLPASSSPPMAVMSRWDNSGHQVSNAP
jgi:hypothetical protein